nr:integrase, catalytic region, zinc finger, CCHC-type, peptidase aspartic, catalytic [Tanacetum cinerariifolium]
MKVLVAAKCIYCRQEKVFAPGGLSISRIPIEPSSTKLCKRNQAKTFKRVILGVLGENTRFSIYRVKVLFEVLRTELGELGSELTSSAASELGSELTSLAGSELGLVSYRLIEDYFSANCEQELCPFNFLLASCQVSSSELSLGFDTRPPMLDRTDFASWKQRIRQYYQGKENGVNILKSIDEGPFRMGTLRETLTEGTEDALHLGPERPRVYSDLTSKEKERFVTVIKLNRGLRDSNYDKLYAYLKQHEVHANENKMMLDRFTQHTVDPLALMSNISNQQHYLQSSITPPSIYVQPHSVDTT